MLESADRNWNISQKIKLVIYFLFSEFQLKDIKHVWYFSADFRIHIVFILHASPGIKAHVSARLVVCDPQSFNVTATIYKIWR